MLFLAACNNDLDEAGFVNSKYDVSTRFAMSMDWNSNHPAQNIIVNDSSYSVVVCGDTHIGTHEKFSRVLQVSQFPGTAALIVAGDITRGHPENYDTLFNLMQTIDSTNCFFVPGNHDLYFGGWEYFYNYFGSSVYYFTVTSLSGNDLFLILDSGSGTLGHEQTDWLRDFLKNKRQSYRNCFVVTHLNIFKNGAGMATNLPVEEMYTVIDLFSEYNINYEISGHDHDRDERFLGNTSFITMDACRDDEQGSSYLELKVSTGSIQHVFHDLN